MVAEHGLRGIAGHYIKELRTLRERRAGTMHEVTHSLRSFLRWLWPHLGLDHGARVDPTVLSVPLLQDWWGWMVSDDRVSVVPVRRRNRTYERTYKGALKRSSAYKEWTTIVAFWRWAAQVEEFGGAVPMCPTERLRKSYRDPNKKAGARRPVVAASWEQAARCIAAATDWVRPLAILCYYTGLRVGQARSLTWDDVHLDGPFAKENDGPVLWVGQGKTPAEGDGRFLPLHPSLAGWLRQRKREVPTVEALSRDLRRTDTAAYKARAAGLAEGRIAWEGGNQNLSLQFCRAWKKAEVPAAVWELRPAHAFRKALRTNVMNASTEPGSMAWQAAERLLGHALPGQLDAYQSHRVLMPTMRRLIETIPPWEEAAKVKAETAARWGGKVIRLPSLVNDEDMAALG